MLEKVIKFYETSRKDSEASEDITENIKLWVHLVFPVKVRLEQSCQDEKDLMMKTASKYLFLSVWNWKVREKRSVNWKTEASMGQDIHE